MKGNIFQYVLIGIFVVFAIGGVIAFALYKGSSKPPVELVVWGELPRAVFSNVTASNPSLEGFNFEYTYVAPQEFDERLTDALSSGRGPDIVLMSSERLLLHRSRLIQLSPEAYDPRDFEESFLTQLGSVYESSRGLEGLPLLVDPLVMYWNEELLRNAGILIPPETWDELPSLVDRVTEFGSSQQIVQSAIPFGSFGNYQYAKYSLASLLFQSGTPIVVATSRGLSSALTTSDGGIVGAQYAVNFFTEFSDPLKSLYTWNSTLSPAEAMFLRGDLALYPALASEAEELLQKNPNLSIRMSEFPQAQGGRKVVYAHAYGLSITRKGENKYAGAVQAIAALSSQENIQRFVDAASLAPARKSLYGSVETGSIDQRVMYDSAIVSQLWSDPDPEVTTDIFSRMVSAVSSGQLRVTEALSNAHRELENLVE